MLPTFTFSRMLPIRNTPGVSAIRRHIPALMALLLISCHGSDGRTKSSATDSSGHTAPNPIELLNVSYDPTRELFEEYNTHFAEYWKQRTGQVVNVAQSHGGSGKQSRSVIDGLPADVVTLALAYDIDAIAARTDLLPHDWRAKLPHNSTPFTSTIVFLVRKGNPKGIRDWGDLIRNDVSVVTANPKTSGAARWSYLAAWIFAEKQSGSEEGARQFIKDLYARVPVLDTGARGSTVTFVERGIGDVLLAWENEAFLTVKESGSEKVEILYPSISVLAEPPVAVIEKNAAKKGALEVARAYLEQLYTPESQKILARHGYRPVLPEILSELARPFPSLPMVSVEKLGGWKTVQQKHFDDGGIFDQIYEGNR